MSQNLNKNQHAHMKTSQISQFNLEYYDNNNAYRTAITSDTNCGSDNKKYLPNLQFIHLFTNKTRSNIIYTKILHNLATKNTENPEKREQKKMQQKK